MYGAMRGARIFILPLLYLKNNFVMKNEANCVIIYEIVGERVYEKRNNG